MKLTLLPTCRVTAHRPCADWHPGTTVSGRGFSSSAASTTRTRGIFQVLLDSGGWRLL